ncbi:hypothetical protein CBL_20401 [Carabus blaptoides fortunei]
MDVNEDNKITEHVSDLACRKALWPVDDTNLENSNNSEDGKILTRNVEHNVSIDEMSCNSEPYAESSDEEYKPESTSDSDEQAVNVDFNETSMDIWSENLPDSGVYKELVLKFPRHLIRKHRNEKEVEKLCSLPPRDSKRINILSKLRKLGNFQYNCKALEKKEGNIIVKRRSQEAVKPKIIYLAIYAWGIIRNVICTCIINGVIVVRKMINPTGYKRPDVLYYHLAKQTIDESKWKKPVNLPSSESIKQFMNRLSKVLLVNLLVFNRCRAVEAQMLRVSEFKKRHSIEKHSDLYNMLTDVEKQVSDKYSRVQVRGKLRNGVPIVLTNFQVKIINLILKNLPRAHVCETNPYVFGRLSKSFVRATDAIRQLTEESGVKEPEKLRSTTLRKQLSTQVQSLNLKDNELDDLAGSLGHDIRDTTQKPKVPNDRRLISCYEVLRR